MNRSREHKPTSPENTNVPSQSFWLGAVIVVSLSLQFGLLWFRDFDPDEFQHLHAAWCVSKGLVPYVDFFGHHTPGLWFLLAPLMRLLRPEADFSSAVQTLFLCRALMLGLSGLILMFTWKLGRLWRGNDLGATAAALLACTLMFLEKSMETRVDVPAPLALMACLYVLFKAFKNPDQNGNAAFASSGLLFGCALMFTQKMLFVVPGLSMALGWYVMDRRIGKTRGKKLVETAIFAGSMLVPAIIVSVYFYAHHALYEFFYSNFIFNSDWRMRFSPVLTFNKLLRQNSVATILGIAGFLSAMAVVWRREAVARGDFLLVFPFASFAAGAFILPVPQREYFMEFLPLGALFAASALDDALNTFSAFGRKKTGEGETLRFRILILSAAACAFLVARDDLKMVDKHGLRLAIALLLAMAIAASFFQSPGGWPKLIATISLCAYGMGQAVKYSSWTNFETLNNIRYVDRNAAPGETVMDGWNGVGVFRPNAWHYYFLHTEILYMLDRPQVRRLIEGFESGEIAPKVIFLDEFVRAINPRLTDYLRRNYTATLVSERGTFLVRRSVPFPPNWSAYAPQGRSKLPLPGEFDLVVQ